MRSAGPPIASGSLSVGGTCTKPSLRPPGAVCTAGIAPVISLADTGEVVGIEVVCGIVADAVLSESFGAGLGLLSDCRPIGVGEVIEGVTGSGVAGLAPAAAGG